MLKITKDGESGASLEPLGYINGRSLISRIVLPLTRWFRAINTEKYMVPAQRHLDIGCGDGYFIRRSKCEERFGLDNLLGDEVTDKLNFPDDYFDYVTMLAVIEHISKPKAIFTEIERILKPGGQFIMTTPKKSADLLLKLYAKDIAEEHELYFNLSKIRELAGNLFEVAGHHTFILGLNQAFCLKKNVGINSGRTKEN